VLLLHPYIIDISVFNTALAKATSTEGEWFSELRVIEKLLDSGVEGVAIESALIKGAQALNHDCLKLLSTRVDRSEVYSSALAAAQTNKNWRQSLDVVEFLLSHGANGEPVDNAFISAAGSLDYRAASLLAGHVDNEDADCRGFTAATSNDTWLSAGHLDLLKLLYGRRMPLNVVKPALIAAAEAFNLPAVELLAQNANGNMASAAFASATATGKDWVSPEGTSVLEILAQKGAAGHSVEQALISSAQQLRLDLVKTLVPNIDKDNLQCFSSAFDAVVTTGHTWLSRPEPLDILQILIEKGASAQSAQNALVDAAQNGNLDAVNVLVQVVHDLDAYTEAFNTLTQSGTLWLEDDSHELLALLLSRGASGEGLHIALISAMQEVILGYASADLLTLLLSHGADVNYEDGRALQLASRSGRLDLFDLLLAYGPDSITLYMGLQEALCSEHEEELVLEFFISIVANDSLEMKPDVNHDSDLGRPLLFYCLMHYPFSVDLVKELCDCGADLTATISWTVYEDEPNFPPVLEDKITPLLFALQNNASDEVVLDVLLAYGGKFLFVSPLIS
jgi:ankyrin repeat protein